MAFPTITTKMKNFVATPALITSLEKKLSTLGRLLPAHKKVVCEVELGKVSPHKHGGPIYRAEVNLDLGTRLVRAVAVEASMENAIDRVKNELKTELQKAGSRGKTLARTGARKAKELTRRASR